ncbi:methylated-DNA-[protein]-cysteine S-methyltransferase [Parapedobacter composti]|uniref:Methylated-DNA--protein-cysteine methyltransferase n=1 Tax=Parapedobacter composti TaxID=623281 RepID=A0A1I1DZX3_9SPHI|nr:methylated-DNA--[protein]-cysteine S-methyltransferase [Parapedobacter composti]SFB78113.1 methylated-DNA-[protein]-cysteine S-methyltransferase [Parapedobacter composti]
MDYQEAFLQTPLGTAAIKGHARGLVSITVVDADAAAAPSATIPAALAVAAEQLQEYFAGERTTFQLRLDFRGTAFQQRVWQALLDIPFGKTCSYLELARKLGDVKAIRAVAAANGQNPFWIVVPCHRIVGSDGSLTGYAGGLWRKKWLLEHENPYKQQLLF